MPRTIVIGDIHGCFDELQELIDRVAPMVDDQIIALGDIVDRGPDTEKVLEFFRDTPNAMSLMGNHERKHIRSARGETRPALSQLIVKHQLGDCYARWLMFMETFPRHVELPEAILVHGFLEPGIPLEAQRDGVVIGTLSGEAYITEKYAGPWYDHYRCPKPVVVGHHDYLRAGEPLIRDGLVYAIDTGVVHGNRLTALVLPEFHLVSVPSGGDYWSRVRRQYAPLAASSRSDLDLPWELLTAYAESADTEDLPEHLQKRARRCVAIADACNRIIGEVVDTVRVLSNNLLRELAQTEDWETCSPRAKAARYARRVGDHPAAHLLLAARRAELDERTVYRQPMSLIP